MMSPYEQPNPKGMNTMPIYGEEKMTTTGLQGSGGTYGNKLNPPRSAPDFTAQVAGAAEDVHSLRMRIESLADRLCGAAPEAADGHGLSEVPNGVFGAIVEHGRNISANVAYAREALDRIERALP
jgi:hypothetical protein